MQVCVACTSVRDADKESEKMAVVLSRKHALELEVKWVHMCASVCTYACVYTLLWVARWSDECTLIMLSGWLTCTFSCSCSCSCLCVCPCVFNFYRVRTIFCKILWSPTLHKDVLNCDCYHSTNQHSTRLRLVHLFSYCCFRETMLMPS